MTLGFSHVKSNPRSNLDTVRRYNLLGVEVGTYDKNLIHDKISSSIASKSQTLLLHHNLHSIYLYHRDPALRGLYGCADGIWIDGMPIVYWGKVMGKSLNRDNRFTMSQWMPDFMERARDEGWRIYYIGSAPGVAEKGISLFRERFPGLQIACRHGFFDMSPNSPENLKVVSAINDYHPDVLLVGMGMPRQERWIAENRHHLDANVIANVGAAINYFAGALQRPPAVLSRLGLEWLFRLTCEPRRLSRRYLLEPWHLIPVMAGDIAARLKSPTPTDQEVR